MTAFRTLRAATTTLLFFSAGAAGAQWMTNGPNIVWTDDDVGIGTSNPITGLQIVDDLSFSGAGGILLQSETAPAAGAQVLVMRMHHQGPNFPAGGLAWSFEIPGNIAGRNGDFELREVGPGTSVAHLLVRPGTGNVGIGTSNPLHKLDVSGTGRFSGKLTLTSGGDALLFSGGGVQNLRLTNDNILNVNNLTINDTGQNEGIDWKLGRNISVFENGQGGHRAFQFNTTASYPFVFNGGNVGIGTTSPQSLLAVDGKITAREVEVKATGWADHVFEEAYRLMPLAEVAEHIEAQGHLPGIPSAEEVMARGVDLGAMQVKLLEKVEELTLHMIALERQNETLKNRLVSLETASEGS